MAYCYRHPDRETGLSCSECGRPICYECMTPAPVGLRCPDHSGKPQGAAQRITRTVPHVSYDSGDIVTKILIGANVAIWLLMLLNGSTVSNPGGSIFEKYSLVGSALDSHGNAIGVAHGEYWRLITSAFLHASLFHVGMNMLVLWFVGAPLERAVGHARFILIYFVSALAGAAGALLQAPHPYTPTVGASGAIFGLFGAALVMERQGFMVLGGSAMSLIVINLVFSFLWPNVSWGGHVGGLVGGALCALVLSRFGRGHAAYSKLDPVAVAGLLAVGALSVLVAYWRVRGYT